MIYFLPLLGALIGASAVILSYWLFFSKIISLRKNELVQLFSDFIVKRLQIDELLRKKLDEANFKDYVEDLINQQLDNFINVLKQQIPMGGTFLTGALASKLKSQGREEIMKMLPELKRHLTEKLANAIDVKELLNEMTHADATPELKRNLLLLFRADIRRLICYGALIGFGVGLLESLFFLWV
jgi:uncharacterized membrane protein YheB (UPF0754 family)